MSDEREMNHPLFHFLSPSALTTTTPVTLLEIMTLSRTILAPQARRTTSPSEKGARISLMQNAFKTQMESETNQR